MNNNVEIISEEKEKAYEPPVFRRVNLEIKTSLLAVCALSLGFDSTANPATCLDPINFCFN